MVADLLDLLHFSLTKYTQQQQQHLNYDETLYKQ